jgi:hypothetical protein
MATAGVATLEAVDLAAAAEQYATQGFVLVKNLLTNDEAAAYRTESHRLLMALGGQDDPTWASARSVAGDQATRLMHLHDAQFYSAAFSRLLVDERFTSLAAAVLGAPGNVQLHHTKLFVKPPQNGSPFPLHQDHPFFPHTLHRVGAAISTLTTSLKKGAASGSSPAAISGGRSSTTRAGAFICPTSRSSRLSRCRPGQVTCSSLPT